MNKKAQEKKKYYLRNKEKILSNWKKQYKNRREWLNKIKQQPCADCGFSFHPTVMQFHHIRDKKFQIARNIVSKSKETILKEINKCILLCANCHTIRTHCPPNEWELERLLSQWEKEARMRAPEFRRAKCWKCGKEVSKMYHIFFRNGLREAHLCKKCGKPYEIDLT